MRLDIYIRHVQLIACKGVHSHPWPLQVEPGAENWDIPSTSPPNAHQQDVVPRKEGRWGDTP